jgi:glyoxylate reductase
MKKQILVTRRIPDAGLKLLKGYKVTMHRQDRSMSRKELLRAAAGVDGLLCQLVDTIDGALMDAAGPQLKVIANYAVGYNNIDLAAAKARGIIVTNTPGVLTETTADLAWALLMSVARRVGEGERMVRAGKFKGTSPTTLLGGDIYGKTLGVVGFGRIGQAVARRGKGFQMKVLYCSRRPVSDGPKGASRVSLEQLLEQSDFVSLNVPLNDSTKDMIRASELSMMKRTAYLINTARGAVVDEKALVAALRKGTIAGAGLDVYENEPKLAAGLAKLNNVVLLPHVGSASLETRGKMAEMAAGSIVDVLKGVAPSNVVGE